MKMLNVPHLPHPLNLLDEIEKCGATVLTSWENLELIEKREQRRKGRLSKMQSEEKMRRREKEKAKEEGKSENKEVKTRRQTAKTNCEEKETKAKQNKNAKKTQPKRHSARAPKVCIK